MEDSKSVELLDTIKEKLQQILDRKFKNDSFSKRKIDVYHDRFAFSCPVCGDSLYNSRKKRGNLYFNSMQYHCYNCGEHYGIVSLLKLFNQELSLDDKIAVREIQQNAKHFERRTASTQSSIVYSVIDELAIPKKIFFGKMGVVSPYKNEECSEYLKSRKIDITKWNCFAYRPVSKELYILNLTPNDRIIGYQIRQLDKDSDKPRYLTRNITKMYKDVFGVASLDIINKLLMRKELGEKYIEEEDGIENVVANIEKISGIFNIMNINMNQTITIVEGPIDSLALHNCVALQGAKKMNDYFDEAENVRYIFDMDKAGKQESIKKIKKHKKVFLWELYVKKCKIKEKVKDLNDLQRNNCLNCELMEECFSDDELDIIMI